VAGEFTGAWVPGAGDVLTGAVLRLVDAPAARLTTSDHISRGGSPVKSNILHSVSGRRLAWRLAAGALCAAALPGLVSDVHAQFAAPVSLPVATAPESVAVGDWDKDGDEDLAIAVSTPERVVFLFNDGHENFITPTEVLLGAGTSPSAIVAADFDGDDDLDIAVAQRGTNSVRLLVNNGGGSFALAGETSTGFNPIVLRVADLNGGAPDLVSCNSVGNSITVMLNDGSGVFSASTFTVGAGPSDVNVGDLNGDGDIDIAVVAHDARRIDLFANSGTGAFASAGTLFVGGGLQPSGLAIVDVDHDGDLDLAVTLSGGGLNLASIYGNGGPGTGAGAFGGPVSLAVGALNPTRIVDGDFNHDGNADLATLNKDSGNLSVMLGDGLGHFGPAGHFTVGALPVALLAADVDDNGGMDLLTADETGNDVSLLINLNGNSAFVAMPDTGLAGVSGIPTLAGDGTLQGGTTVSLQLTGAAVNAAGALVASLSQVNVPFKGGVLVPDTDVFLVVPISNTGTLTLTGTFPSGLASGTNLYVQVIVADVAAPVGFSLSNAIQGTTP
jgi:FG-GAP-like repeat